MRVFLRDIAGYPDRRSRASGLGVGVLWLKIMTVLYNGWLRSSLGEMRD